MRDCSIYCVRYALTTSQEHPQKYEQLTCMQAVSWGGLCSPSLDFLKYAPFLKEDFERTVRNSSAFAKGVNHANDKITLLKVPSAAVCGAQFAKRYGRLPQAECRLARWLYQKTIRHPQFEVLIISCPTWYTCLHSALKNDIVSMTTKH